MIGYLIDLPTWMIIRVVGIASYMLIVIGIALGILYGLPSWSPQTKAALYKMHAFATIGGTGIGMLHGIFTVIDAYVPYSWSELLIPFTAHYKPFLSGLGTLSVYLMLIVILTTDLRNKMKRKVWLALHMMSYPVFVMATVHGFFEGSDSGVTGIRFMYMAAIVIVLALTAVRSAIRPARPEKLKVDVIPPRHAGPRLQEVRPTSRDR